VKHVYRSIKFSLLEWLAIFPALLWINTLLLDSFFTELNWFYFPLVYLLASIGGWMIKKNSLKLIASALIAGLIVVLLPLDSVWHQLLIFMLMSAASLRGFQYSQDHLEQVFPIGLMWTASLPSYFLSYILYRGPSSVDERQLLTIFALVLLFFLLFLTNQEHLSKASLVNRNVKQMNKKMRIQNSLYVFLFFILVLLITRFNFIAAGIVYLIRKFFQLLGMGSQESELSHQVEVDMDVFDLGPTKEPALWLQILDQIIKVVGLVIAGLALLFILYQLLKRIPFFAKKIKALTEKIIQILLQIRKGRSFEQSEGYVDETESVFDLTKSVDQFVDKMRGRFKRKPNWRTLTDKQKARWIFHQVIERGVDQGYQFYRYETAQESLNRLEAELIQDRALTASLASIYDQARYSSLAPSQIDQLKMELERKGWI